MSRSAESFLIVFCERAGKILFSMAAQELKQRRTRSFTPSPAIAVPFVDTGSLPPPGAHRIAPGFHMLGLSGLGSALVLSPFLLPDATALTAPSANQRRHLQNMARMAMTSPAGETHMRPSTPPKSGPAEPAANFDSLNVALKHHVPLST